MRFCIFLFCSFFLLGFRDPKKEICSYQEKLNQADSSKRSEILVSLAKAYYRDQNAEMAFKTYIDALDAFPRESFLQSQIEEDPLYEKAFEYYIQNNRGDGILETAEELISKYGQMVREHPEYVQLNFLIAAAYANQNQFEEFFDRFYTSYCLLPEHYLAYKTKAILHIKMLERIRDEEEREEQRMAILSNAMKANHLCPQDPSLYKVMLTFAPQAEKEKVVKTVLQKIVETNMIIPRGDVVFYVTEAIFFGEQHLAQQLVDKAKETYQTSRIVEKAQDLVHSD